MNPAQYSLTQRAIFFQLAAIGFAHPDEELCSLIASGELPAELYRSATQGFDTEIPRLHCDAASLRELEARYINLFHVGRRGRPLVHLNAGEHEDISAGLNRPELLLRYSAWYRHFGLTVEDNDTNELPDHLSCQLEFLSWLLTLEARASVAELIAGYRQARSDFIEKELRPFVSVLAEELRAKAPETIYPELIHAVSICLSAIEYEEQAFTPTSPPADNTEIATVNLWE